MPRKPHGAIRQDLHALIAAERLEVTEIKLETAIPDRDDFLDLAAVRVLAIRSKPHHFPFIAVFGVADEFADHRVETPQGVRKEHAVEDLYVVAFAGSHHCRNEVARTVVAKPCGFFPWRAVIGAG